MAFCPACVPRVPMCARFGRVSRLTPRGRGQEELIAAAEEEEDVHHDEVDEFITELDADGDGGVSWQEYVDALFSQVRAGAGGSAGPAGPTRRRRPPPPPGL